MEPQISADIVGVWMWIRKKIGRINLEKAVGQEFTGSTG
jgi:hypothetical protein